MKKIIFGLMFSFLFINACKPSYYLYTEKDFKKVAEQTNWEYLDEKNEYTVWYNDKIGYLYIKSCDINKNYICNARLYTISDIQMNIAEIFNYDFEYYCEYSKDTLFCTKEYLKTLFYKDGGYYVVETQVLKE